MAMTFLLALVVQQLEVSPFPAEVGQEVIVRATAADQRRLTGLSITLDQPDGSRQPLGVTDQNGELRCTPTQVGACCFRAAVDGAELLAPHDVLPPRRRWLYGIVCLPLGAVLLWRNLRRRNDAERAPSA